MDIWVKLLLPFALLLGRISAFFAVLPLFSWRALPMRVRAAMALLMTIFFATITPRPALADNISPLAAGILLIREIRDQTRRLESAEACGAAAAA